MCHLKLPDKLVSQADLCKKLDVLKAQLMMSTGNLLFETCISIYLILVDVVLVGTIFTTQLQICGTSMCGMFAYHCCIPFDQCQLV